MLPQSLVDLLPSLPLPLSPSESTGDAGFATGVEMLDAALGGGLPRGRLTELTGPRGSGKATLLRRIVERAVGRAEWVGYVDAQRTLAPRDWAHLGGAEGLWMIRPRDPGRAAWCADVLLRSGAFSLLVMDAAPPLTRAVAVRLTRLARAAGAALVIVGDDDGGTASLLGGAVRLRVTRAAERGGGRGERRDAGEGRHRPLRIARDPDDERRHERERRRRERMEGGERRLSIVVEKGGIHRTVEVSCAIGVARRLCAHPQVPDRRGVARRAPGRSGSDVGAAAPSVRGAGVHDGAAGGRVAARKQRCAEPDYPPAAAGGAGAVARARALG